MLRNLLAVAWVYFFGADANYRTTDLVCLDKFGIPSDTKSLNSAYYVLQQNKNKVEDLSLFTKCTEGMPTNMLSLFPPFPKCKQLISLAGRD